MANWRGGYFEDWRPYVSAGERRRQAVREIERNRKKGHDVSPVIIQGRTIAATFWGKSWCENLEGYSDFANRLPRGRTYVRSGAVIDLQIKPGEIAAMVSGSSLYNVSLAIAALPADHWKAICRDCAGGIDSVIELLQGRFSKAVMERICRQADGLFPSPREIKLSCSCPDWAAMCKHVAAVLYGIGARLDHQPELLFRLRGVDENELIASAGSAMSFDLGAPPSRRVLQGEDLGALFGLELVTEASAASNEPKTVVKRPRQRLPR
ncbi:MAG: SWIM zinc finger family protein [Bryobacterales bacterium]|nr:SWIM zinc finger family protein [Bryobacterales bacterium]